MSESRPDVTTSNLRRWRKVIQSFHLEGERASYNGSIEASQASDVGSIPIARSINLDDSIALTRPSRLKYPIKHLFLDASWTLRFQLDAEARLPFPARSGRVDE